MTLSLPRLTCPNSSCVDHRKIIYSAGSPCSSHSLTYFHYSGNNYAGFILTNEQDSEALSECSSGTSCFFTRHPNSLSARFQPHLPPVGLVGLTLPDTGFAQAGGMRLAQTSHKHVRRYSIGGCQQSNGQTYRCPFGLEEKRETQFCIFHPFFHNYPGENYG